jgi:regulatory protein
MAEITKIKAQRNKKRVNIYLDGKFAFGLPAETLVKAGLKLGQKLAEKQIENLIFKNEFQKLLDKVYRILSLRPRSEKEIEDYLKKKIWKFRKGQSKTKDKMIGEIISVLKEQKLIDDLAFAAWWIEQRASFRPRGKMALRMELRRKGVNQEFIDEIIEKVDELSLAKKAAQKKLKSFKKLDPPEFREKMSAFLARYGFSWGVVKVVIDDLAKKR